MTTEVRTQGLPPSLEAQLGEYLGMARALAMRPYQTYDRDRIAQFTPLQLQAFQEAQGVRPRGGSAESIAQEVASRAFGAGRHDALVPTTDRFTTPGAAASYISPYIQNVVDIEKREAMRSDDIARQGRNARAVGAGAFGGTRQAIVEAEAERELQRNLADIQNRGLQAAFDRAQQAFMTDEERRLKAQQLFEQSRQFGSELGLQGLNAALNAGRTLGDLGQQQFNQNLAGINLRNQFGTQQQGQVQNILNMNYQDFLNQQRFPYQQLGFALDAVRGAGGMLGQTTNTMYTPPPSMSQLLMGGGMALMGGRNMNAFAEGGEVPAPAEVAGLADLAVYQMGW